MKLSITPGLGLALSLVLLLPAAGMAESALSSIVKDSLRITRAIDGDVGDSVVGNVDASGRVIDSRGNTIGRVVTPGYSASDKLVSVDSRFAGQSGSLMNALMLGTTNDVYGDSIATRRTDLTQAVSVAEMAGKITQSQAAHLRSDLSGIAVNEADAESDDLLTFDETLSLAHDLDRVNTRLATLMNIQPFELLVSLDKLGVERVRVSRRTGVAPGSTHCETGTVTENGLATTTSITLIDSQPENEIAEEAYLSTLDKRRIQLGDALADGETSATVSRAQLRSLRAELDRVAKAQVEERTTPFSYQAALPLALSLDYVGNVVQSIVPSATFVPIIDGRRFIVSDGRVLVLDDVMVRRAELESRIVREVDNGRLSGSQGRYLLRELGRIRGIEEQMRSRGRLTFTDSRTLYQMFDEVGSGLDRSVASNRTEHRKYY